MTTKPEQGQMTDAERYVRSKVLIPISVCGPMRNGCYHPDGGYWIVFGCASGPCGSGPTLIAAWADAANRLEAREKSYAKS